MVIHRHDDAMKLKLNEWGDLFAGTIAPLAFLWLILGFLQQGEELQLNTKAIELQAEELAKSVEHQNQMVQISRIQLENEVEAARIERQAQREAARPKFISIGSGGSFSGIESNYSLNFKNIGNTCTQALVTFEPSNPNARTIEIPVISRGDPLSLSLRYPSPPTTPVKMTISFVDSNGFPGECGFMLTRDSDHPHASFKVLPVGPNP